MREKPIREQHADEENNPKAEKRKKDNSLFCIKVKNITCFDVMW